MRREGLDVLVSVGRRHLVAMQTNQYSDIAFCRLMTWVLAIASMATEALVPKLLILSL